MVCIILFNLNLSNYTPSVGIWSFYCCSWFDDILLRIFESILICVIGLLFSFCDITVYFWYHSNIWLNGSIGRISVYLTLWKTLKSLSMKTLMVCKNFILNSYEYELLFWKTWLPFPWPSLSNKLLCFFLTQP